MDGRAEGLWVEWYESGVPRYLATWRGGKGEGAWTYFHETGEVRERSVVVGDRFDGPVEGWHANGRKAFEGRVPPEPEGRHVPLLGRERPASTRTETYEGGVRTD